MTLHQSAVALLQQLRVVCEALDKEGFSQQIAELSGASIGEHVRHTLEFFLCLIDGRNDGVINYDERRHDTYISQDPKLALSVIDSIQQFLHKEQADFPLKHEANYAISGDDVHTMPSSFYRELAYNIEHTIHHMALIKIGILQHFDDVTLPEHFGVASSTVRYLRQQDQ